MQTCTDYTLALLKRLFCSPSLSHSSQASSNGSELAHLGQPGPSHPKEFKPKAMQLWDHQYMKEGRFSQFGSHGDDGVQVRNLTKADCTSTLHLNKFQPDSMALKVAMEMKSKTNPVVQQVTTMTTSSKALPINYGLFADFLIEDRSRMAR